MPVLLGLTGKKGAGKDSAYHCLEAWGSERGVCVVRRGFADKLKESADALIGLWEATEPLDELRPKDFLAAMDVFKEAGKIEFEVDGLHWSMSGREFLQRFGTEAHRDVFGTNFWIDVLLPRGGGDRGEHIKWPYQFSNPPPDLCVITDVRFDDEAARIKELGGTIWAIVRRSTSGSQDAHSSEAGVDPEYIDYTIFNNFGLSVLNRVIRSSAGVLLKDIAKERGWSL